MAPNYKDYSLHELEDALAHIDRNKFPERTQLLIREIEARVEKNEKQEQPSVPEFNENLHPNWVVRYWKGQVSLPMSYWVVGIAVNLICLGLVKLTEHWIEQATSSTQLGLHILALYSVIILLLVWQLVGLFRSAGFHPLRGGSVGWAIAAKVMVFIGVLNFSNQMYTSGFSIMNGAFQDLTGVERYPEIQFRILNSGTDLELFGGLEIGAENSLEKQLQQYPSVERIHLHSTGGRILAAKRMMKIIRKHSLDTYVKTECASACTLMFLAGKTKLLGDGGQLKFHSPSIGAASGHEIKELAQELEDAYLNEGLPKWFVKKAINTPSNSFWAPTNDDLLKANVVDQIVNPDDYAHSGLGTESQITEKDIESGLLTKDFMAAMKEHDPEAYKKALNINYIGLLKGLPLNDIANQLADFLYNKRLPIYLANASNSAIVEYWKAQIVHMKELKDDYPLACASFVYPNEVPAEKRYGNEGGISTETKALEGKAIAYLIRTYQGEYEDLNKEAQQSLIQKVITKVREQSEDYFKVIGSAKDYVTKPELMCSASIALNEAFLSFDVETSGQLLRSLQ